MKLRKFAPANLAISSLLACAALVSNSSAGTKLHSFDTAGGTLQCAESLCTTTREPATESGQASGLLRSEHIVWLRRAQKAPLYLQCDDERQGSPSCMPMSKNFSAAGAAVPGTQMVVPGDGCLYAIESASKKGAVTRMFCLESGILVEKS